MPRAKKKSSVFSAIRKEFGRENYGIKNFRSDLKKLVKAGLATPKIDISKQLPTKYLLGEIRKFQDVLTGKAKTIHVGKKETQPYKQGGYHVKGQTVIVPVVQPGARVKRLKPDELSGLPRFEVRNVERNRDTGQVRTKISTRSPVPKGDFEEYIRRLVDDVSLDKGQYIAFRFHGGISSELFKSKEDLLKYFLKYDQAIRAAKGDVEEANDAIANFEVVTFDYKKPHASELKSRNKRRSEARRAYWRKLESERLNRQLNSPDELERLRARVKQKENREGAARRQKAYRERLKSDPDKYLGELKKASERARKKRGK